MYRLKKHIFNISAAIIFVIFLNIHLVSATPVDYDTIKSDVGEAVTSNSNFLETVSFEYFSTLTGTKMGDLTVNLFGYYDQYLYELILDPDDQEAHDISSFSISGISGYVYDSAGYSFNDAMAAIGYHDAGQYADHEAIPGDQFFTESYSQRISTLLFRIGSDPDLTGTDAQLNWPPDDVSGEALHVTFFYESTDRIEDLSDLTYTVANGITITIPNPVPEPGTMVLLLTGFGCLAGVKIRNKLNLKKRNS